MPIFHAYSINVMSNEKQTQKCCIRSKARSKRCCQLSMELIMRTKWRTRCVCTVHSIHKHTDIVCTERFCLHTFHWSNVCDTNKVTASTRIHSIICCVHYNVCTKLSGMPHAHKTLNYLDELALECYSSIWFLFTSILWSNFRKN